MSATNTLLEPTVIAKEALRLFGNNLVMGNNVYREFKKEFVKIGSDVTIRKPVRFASGSAESISGNVNNTVEMSTSISVDQIRNVSWEFSGSDLTLTIDQYSKRYLEPAMVQLANDVDVSLTGLYKSVANCAGSAGVTPNSFKAIGDVNTKLDEFGTPKSGRNLVLNPDATWSMMDALKGVFSEAMVNDFVKHGRLKTVAGMDIYGDQNVVQHSQATISGTPLIDEVGGVTYITAATADTSTIHVDGITTGDIVEGDVFTIADVYAVNPISKQSTGKLQQFTVTADVDQAADMSLVVKPALRASGAYQSVDAVPIAEAAVTFIGSHAANLAFHKNAFALVVVPMEVPKSAGWGARETYEDLSLRIVKGYNVTTNIETCRIDVMYGVKVLYPELACRLLG